MPKVLIADDHREMRRLWAINLTVRGYQVIEASDGGEGLRMIRDQHPDVILLDLTMPVLSGWEVLQALRDKAIVTAAPVVVLTGWADKGARDRALELGASEALVKPLGIETLLKHLNRVMKGSTCDTR